MRRSKSCNDVCTNEYVIYEIMSFYEFLMVRSSFNNSDEQLPYGFRGGLLHF